MHCGHLASIHQSNRKVVVVNHLIDSLKHIYWHILRRSRVSLRYFLADCFHTYSFTCAAMCASHYAVAAVDSCVGTLLAPKSKFGLDSTPTLMRVIKLCVQGDASLLPHVPSDVVSAVTQYGTQVRVYVRDARVQTFHPVEFDIDFSTVAAAPKHTIGIFNFTMNVTNWKWQVTDTRNYLDTL
jgi:hypothetical protein